MSQTLPIIGITMGDPVGIGPEITVSAHTRSDLYKVCRPIVFGDENILKMISATSHSDVTIHTLNDIEEAVWHPGSLNLISLSALDTNLLKWGSPSVETSTAMIRYIKTATEYVIQDQAHALVTSPITKTAMKLAGSEFHGHTEYLAHLTGADRFRMMMAGDRLKVVLVTIHIPLKKVPEQLSVHQILETLIITDTALKKNFGLPVPRIAVAGLNPHAGEDSMFGSEEQALIIPAIDLAQEKGINAEGPFPPDTVFKKATDGLYDAVISMYHDQGLIPFKMVHFEDGVNTTLGLPIIRTSVDHGTAYDIAGKGIANPSSLISAIKMAAAQASSINPQTDS